MWKSLTIIDNRVDTVSALDGQNNGKTMLRSAYACCAINILSYQFSLLKAFEPAATAVAVPAFGLPIPPGPKS